MSAIATTVHSLAQSRIVLPSLLLCDFGNLKSEVQRLEAAGVEAFHLDVMDGSFVPNFTYGMTIVEAMRRLTKLPIDVHLMMNRPEAYFSAFRAAGADLMTFHAEAVSDVLATIKAAKKTGAAVGVAINPGTPLASVESVLNEIDLLLVMSVDAGFGGQKFNSVALDKLSRARKLAGDRLILEVDGGVNHETIAACAKAGANWYVVGSAIFREPDYGAAVGRLSDLARSV
jgi:ribulose-phosphate 3-epimerase